MSKTKLFAALESPEKGWVLRELARIISSDAPVIWRVELWNETSAEVVVFEHNDLYVAWARATERAHTINLQL